MMTSSNGNIFRVTGHLCGEFTGPGEIPAQRPVRRSFDVFFYLRPYKRLSKQPWGWWFETPSRHFAEDILKCIFLNKKVRIPIKILLKIIPESPNNNIQVLVQIMAWCRQGDKPLSEPMMVILLTHICVTRPQWVKHVLLADKSEIFIDEYLDIVPSLSKHPIEFTPPNIQHREMYTGNGPDRNQFSQNSVLHIYIYIYLMKLISPHIHAVSCAREKFVSYVCSGKNHLVTFV